MIGKIFTPDDCSFVYAENLEQAKEAFFEEVGYHSKDEWKEVSMNAVAYAYEWVGRGGFIEIEFQDFIRTGRYSIPYIFLDMEDEYRYQLEMSEYL